MKNYVVTIRGHTARVKEATKELFKDVERSGKNLEKWRCKREKEKQNQMSQDDDEV